MGTWKSRKVNRSGACERSTCRVTRSDLSNHVPWISDVFVKLPSDS